MSHRKATLLIFAMTLLAGLSSAQQKGDSSPCAVQYENHNQVDYGPLIVQEVRGTVTDPEKVAVPKVCVGIFTEKDHKLVATAESDAGGKFSLQTVPPGRYRLVVKADPLCAANVPLQVVKRQKKKQVLRVHMKPRGLDSCSYADLGTESAASTTSVLIAMALPLIAESRKPEKLQFGQVYGTAVFVNSRVAMTTDAAHWVLVFTGTDGHCSIVLTNASGDYVALLEPGHYCVSGFDRKGEFTSLSAKQMKCVDVANGKDVRLDVMLVKVKK